MIWQCRKCKRHIDGKTYLCPISRKRRDKVCGCEYPDSMSLKKWRFSRDKMWKAVRGYSWHYVRFVNSGFSKWMLGRMLKNYDGTANIDRFDMGYAECRVLSVDNENPRKIDVEG